MAKKMMRVLSILSVGFLLLAVPATVSAQTYSTKRFEKKMFKTKGKSSPSMVREPKAALKAKKAQEKKEKKGKRASEKAFNKRVKKHNELQKPAVRERLETNRKNTDTRYKNRAKTIRKRSKKAKR